MLNKTQRACPRCIAPSNMPSTRSNPSGKSRSAVHPTLAQLFSSVKMLQLTVSKLSRKGITGLPGRDGANGNDGAPGSNGRDGLDGKNGMDGVAGCNGINGKDGVDGAVACSRHGPTATDGTDCASDLVPITPHRIMVTVFGAQHPLPLTFCMKRNAPFKKLLLQTCSRLGLGQDIVNSTLFSLEHQGVRVPALATPDSLGATRSLDLTFVCN